MEGNEIITTLSLKQVQDAMNSVQKVAAPSRGDVHINQPLNNISIAYAQKEENFIATRVFPTVPVVKQADAYYVYDRGSFNSDEMVERKPGTETAGGAYEIDSETYFARVYGYHKDIAEQVKANEDGPLNSERDTVHFVTRKGLIFREVNWASKYFKTGLWHFEIQGVSVASDATAAAAFDATHDTNNKRLKWSDPASTPIEDIRAMCTQVLEETGYEPNVLTLNKRVYDILQDHPDIIARINRGQTPGGPAKTTKAALAELFEVEEILVMKAIQNTANAGQDAVHRFIGGNHALLSYRPQSAGLLVPSAGYTFAWTGMMGMSAMGGRIKRFWLDALSSTRVEHELSFDQKIIGVELGVFFKDIVDVILPTQTG